MTAFCDPYYVLRSVRGGDLVKSTEVRTNIDNIAVHVLDASSTTINGIKRFLDNDAWNLLLKTCKFDIISIHDYIMILSCSGSTSTIIMVILEPDDHEDLKTPTVMYGMVTQ